MNNKKIYLQLYLTNSCNLNCTYCYQDLDRVNIKNMSLSLFLDIIKYFDNFLIEVQLFGGEPLLNIEIINFIVDNWDNNIPKNIEKIELFTNGYLLNKKIINFFSNNRKKTFVNLSIDGNHIIHDKNRVLNNGFQTYDKILEKVNQIEIKDNYAINYCVHPNGVEYFFEGLKNLYNLGFRKIKIMFLYEKIWTKINYIDLYKNLLFIKNDSKLNYIIKGLITINNKNICKTDLLRKLSIDSNGNMFPCSLWVSKFSKNVDFFKYKFNKNFDYKKYLKELKNEKKLENFYSKGNMCEIFQGNIFKNNKLKIHLIIKNIYEKNWN